MKIGRKYIKTKFSTTDEEGNLSKRSKQKGAAPKQAKATLYTE